MTIQRLFFVTKIRSATLATKINKNQGFVLKTIVVNLVVNSGLSFVLAQINATRCISGQNKMIVSYSVFRILYAVRGGWYVSAQAI